MFAKRLPLSLVPSAGVYANGMLLCLANIGTAKDLPSPWKTWQESKIYILQPLEKRGEMDQGIGRLAFYSLVRVAKGFLLGIAMATPLGFLLGMSRTFHRMMDPV